MGRFEHLVGSRGVSGRVEVLVRWRERVVRVIGKGQGRAGCAGGGSGGWGMTRLGTGAVRGPG